jgi:hypothetical protein
LLVILLLHIGALAALVCTLLTPLGEPRGETTAPTRPTLPAYELYPAAAAAVAGTLGQPVRLPLGLHRLTGTRYPLFDSEGHPCAFTSAETALHVVLALPRVKVSRVQQAWRRFVGGAGDSRDGARGDMRPYAEEEDTALADLVQCAAGPSLPTVGRIGTSSAVIRWVDAHVSPLELLAEFSPETGMRHVGQGWLGWCPFHDDRAPDALGRPGTPSFYAVFNRWHGWSWRCLSSNCRHSVGPMCHSFRLYQELLLADVPATIRAARGRWPASDEAQGGSEAAPRVTCRIEGNDDCERRTSASQQRDQGEGNAPGP